MSKQKKKKEVLIEEKRKRRKSNVEKSEEGKVRGRKLEKMKGSDDVIKNEVW